MKILHVFNDLKFSGAEIMYVNAATIFRDKGIELFALSTGNGQSEYAKNFENAGYKVLFKHYHGIRNFYLRLPFLIWLIRFLRKEQIDVVHIHRKAAMWGVAFCAWVAGKKSVYTFHSVFPFKKSTFIYHFMVRWTAKNIFRCNFQTISDSVFEHELKKYFNKTIKIYNWYNSDKFYPAVDEEKNLLRKELGIDQNTLVLISIGGCSDVKRHSEIINALPLVLEEVPNCIYLHLGQGLTEDEEQELSKKLNIIDSIRFLGNQTNVRKYLVVSDFYLMTSRFEGISLTTIEALACKIPAILYNVPGLRDFNKSDNNCVLIPEDFKLLAEKIIYLYKTKHETELMIEKAEKFVKNNYLMKNNAKRIVSLYSFPQ